MARADAPGAPFRVFLSWSGQTSKEIAHALHAWLPRVVPGVTPFVSDRDISGGEPWRRSLFEELTQTDLAILVLTPDNLENPWVLFEAGVVAGRVAEQGGRAPVLLPLACGVDLAHVPSPLASHQARELPLRADPDEEALRRASVLIALDVEHARRGAKQPADPPDDALVRRRALETWEDLRSLLPRPASEPRATPLALDFDKALPYARERMRVEIRPYVEMSGRDAVGAPVRGARFDIDASWIVGREAAGVQRIGPYFYYGRRPHVPCPSGEPDAGPVLPACFEAIDEQCSDEVVVRHEVQPERARIRVCVEARSGGAFAPETTVRAGYRFCLPRLNAPSSEAMRSWWPRAAPRSSATTPAPARWDCEWVQLPFFWAEQRSVTVHLPPELGRALFDRSSDHLEVWVDGRPLSSTHLAGAVRTEHGEGGTTLHVAGYPLPRFAQHTIRVLWPLPERDPWA